MKKKTAIVAFLCMVMIAGLHAQNFKVIVNTSNGISSISKTDLTNIFLKKISKFSNGITASPVDQTENSAVRAEFSNGILKRPASAVKSYWNQQLFSGAGVPPDEKKTEADVINFVKSNPGGIGYVSPGAVTADVKVIEVQ